MASNRSFGQVARRGLLKRVSGLGAMLAASSLLAACSTIVPSAQEPAGAAPSAGNNAVHNVAILVPLSGENADMGASIANAATLGFIDLKASHIRLTSYDTAKGAAAAAKKAMADGNKLILGPLLSDDVAPVIAAARPAGVPIISFSNDAAVAAPGVFLMGQLPSQAVDRVTRYAASQGKRRFAALVPNNIYGQRAADAFQASVKSTGMTLVGIETFDRTGNGAENAARKLAQRGEYDALLIADNGRAAMMVAPIARKNGAGKATILGTELWNTEADLASNSSVRGAWFASISDNLYSEFAKRYQTRFGKNPFRLSTLGYDAALLTVKIGKSWKIGAHFPTKMLTDSGGFIGLDGAFRFLPNGQGERMLEVQQVNAGSFSIIQAAPTQF